jgi:hypothetical protein
MTAEGGGGRWGRTGNRLRLVDDSQRVDGWFCTVWNLTRTIILYYSLHSVAYRFSDMIKYTLTWKIKDSILKCLSLRLVCQ